MRIRTLDEDSTLNEEHDELGIPPLEQVATQPTSQLIEHYLWTFGGAFLLLALAYGVGQFLFPPQAAALVERIAEGLASPAFFTALFVGLLAQVIDGALGMAYGITATTFLLSGGVPPAAASASVHIAEIFTTGLSGWAHWKFGNVDFKLFRRLLIPGVIGAVTGAYVITSVDGDTIKPWISGYLLVMGLYVLLKAYRHHHAHVHREMPKRVGALALTGGFVDAVGGGGWGPVVTTSLIGTGTNPRITIGSVNAAEFFLAIATSGAFAVLVGATYWQVIAGLVIGGAFAAPMAAWLCHHLHARTLLIMVGTLITLLSIYNLVKSI